MKLCKGSVGHPKEPTWAQGGAKDCQNATQRVPRGVLWMTWDALGGVLGNIAISAYICSETSAFADMAHQIEAIMAPR